MSIHYYHLFPALFATNALALGDITSGGYQTRLKKIFGRTLGRYLAGLLR